MAINSSAATLLRHIYGYGFFNKMTLLTPLYAIFMQSHGVTDAGFSWLLMLYPLAILIGQMPATKITNRIGQRYSILVGQALKALGFLIWWLVPTYLGFGIGMLLWGIQYAFSEVTMDTLMYDELDARGAADEYVRGLGRYAQAKAMGVALSAFGSLMMVFGYGWVTIASVVALGISALCVMNIRIMMPRAAKIPQKAHFIDLIRVGWRVSTLTPCILNLMLLALMVVNFAYLDDFLSPIAIAIGIPLKYVGVMPFVLLGASVIGQRVAYKFYHINDYVIYGAICAAGALFGVFSYYYVPAGIVALGAAYFLVGVLNTLLYSRFQDAIPTRFRPIVLSFYSIGSNAANMAVCGIMGLGGALGNWRYGVLMLGLILIWTGIWGALFVRRDCRAPERMDCRGVCTAPQIGPNSAA